MRKRALAGLVMAAMTVGAAAAQAEPVVGIDQSCLAPAGNPAPGSPSGRSATRSTSSARPAIRDQYANPAFGYANMTQGAAL